jgi:hypothetical protein
VWAGGRAGRLSGVHETGPGPPGSDPSSPLFTGPPKGRLSEEPPEQPPEPEAPAPSPALSAPLFAAGAFARGPRDPTSASATRPSQERHPCYGAEPKPEEAPPAHRSLLLCPLRGLLARAQVDRAGMTTGRAHGSSPLSCGPHSYPKLGCSGKRAGLRPSGGLRRAPACCAPLMWRLPPTSAAGVQKRLTIPLRRVRRLRRPSAPRAAARRPARDRSDPRSS